MTEKRFIVETVEITDCKTDKSRIAKVITDTHELCSCEDLYELCDDLNNLAEENEQLKEENKKLIEDWEFSFRTEMAHHRFAEKELQEKIREKQATIEEYEDFCLNLCKFLIGKGLVDEYREEYGKEYKIITKWKGCGSDE